MAFLQFCRGPFAGIKNVGTKLSKFVIQHGRHSITPLKSDARKSQKGKKSAQQTIPSQNVSQQSSEVEENIPPNVYLVFSTLPDSL